MRVLVTGSGGQLGHDCLAVFGAEHTVAGFDLPRFDITDDASVRAAVDVFRPDIIVNCAAYTRVDQAEAEPEAAWAVNAAGAGRMALAAARAGARLVHVSTDYVFDGTRQGPGGYAEDDRPAPACSYGRSKLAGEVAVRNGLSDYVILRTAWLYGLNGRNFLKTILRLCLQRPETPLRVVNDQRGSPTWSRRLAEQIGVLLTRGRGVYHAAGEGGASWFELAGCFLNAMGVEHRLTPCATAEYPTPAKRPAFSVLENRRLDDEKLNHMRPWRQDLREFVRLHRACLLVEAGREGGDSR